MIRVAVLTISDSAVAGTREDRSGPAVAEKAQALGWAVVAREVHKDEVEEIVSALTRLMDKETPDVVITTGGTGLGPRDVTPEATKSVADRDIPGFGELMRAEGRKKARFASLSRGGAAARGSCLIINLPGSPRGAVDSLIAVADLIPHAVDLLHGRTEHKIERHNPATDTPGRHPNNMSIRNLIAGILAAGLVMGQGPVTQPGQVKPPDTQIDPGDLIFRQENVFVMAPVIVHDTRGNIVNGLTPLDFELYDNGKLQKITEDATTHPISLVVAVQSSVNMEKLLPDIRKVGSLFSGLVLGDNGEMAVLSFDHRIQTMTEFTSDADKISNAFKNIKVGSSPNHLNDAAMKGVNMLRTRDKARRRILLLIAETRDNGSQMGVRDVLTEAEFKDITVYTVEVSHLLTSLTGRTEAPRSNGIPPEARHYPAGIIGTPTIEAQQNMGDYSPAIKEIFTAIKAIFISNPQEVYTKYTGGREYSYMTQKGLQKAIADIGDEIHSQYLLTYLPNNPEDAGYHEIEVRILKPGLKVTTRPGYWSAAKPQ